MPTAYKNLGLLINLFLHSIHYFIQSPRCCTNLYTTFYPKFRTSIVIRMVSFKQRYKRIPCIARSQVRLPRHYVYDCRCRFSEMSLGGQGLSWYTLEDLSLNLFIFNGHYFYSQLKSICIVHFL